MGIFKWSVKFSQCKEFIADGYIIAKSTEEAKERIKKQYSFPFKVLIEIEDWNENPFYFDEETCSKCRKIENNIFIKWECEIEIKYN